MNDEITKTTSLKKRTKQIAIALGLTPTSKTHAMVSDGVWWIVGCEERDQPLPRAGRYLSLREAVERAEAWLAPELNEIGRANKKCEPKKIG